MSETMFYVCILFIFIAITVLSVSVAILARRYASLWEKCDDLCDVVGRFLDIYDEHLETFHCETEDGDGD